MQIHRIALANLPFPSTPDQSVTLALQAIELASNERAEIICFPECFVPGYRGANKPVPPPDPEFLSNAWAEIANAARNGSIAVVLGTERVIDNELRITTLVISREGKTEGFQDKVQLDPSEEGVYAAATERQIFRTDSLTFGVAICHEGWRYPETVRWAVRRGAQVVFHPTFHEAEPGAYVPTAFADPRNTFHEKAALCRAAENTCYFASVNYASNRGLTTSMIAQPDGTVLALQPYGQEGLLIADIDLDAATRLLALRCRMAY